MGQAAREKRRDLEQVRREVAEFLAMYRSKPERKQAAYEQILKVRRAMGKGESRRMG